MKDIDTFVESYVNALLWSNTVCIIDGSGDYDYVEADDYEPSERLKKLSKIDCQKFITENDSVLDQVLSDEYNLSDAGHDFALTRNRHGAGFWDRGLGENGDKLTESSKKFSEVSLYLDDNNLVDID